MARGRYLLTLICALVAVVVVTATLHDHDAMTAGHSADDMAMGHLMPVAPAAAYQAAAQRLPRTGWTATASDEETTGENGRASNVLDGDRATIWHSRWSGTPVPLPHTLTIDMLRNTTISGLYYLPRSAIPNGRIGRFEIAASSNGTTFGAPIATGTWADDDTEKSAAFATVSTRYIRLTAITDAGNRGPWSSAAEINILGEPDLPTATSSPTSVPATSVTVTSPAVTSVSPTSSIPTTVTSGPPATLSRVGWTASASDQESAGENGVAGNVLDGSTATIWHSRWSPTVAPLPHTITIDMKASYQLSGLRYLPRASIPNGRIGSYQIHVSADGVTWGTAAASGTWADNSSEKTVTFAARTGRYIRLTGTSEAGNRGPWSSAAELNVVGIATGGTVTSSPTASPTQTTPIAPSTIATTATSTTPPPSTSPGSWGPVLNFPLVPVAAALLPGNKMLTWSAYLANNFGGNNGRTQTAILDLNTGVITARQISNTGHDMFCPGTSMLADGRMLVSGGSDDRKTSFYNPATDTWTAGPNMNIPRAYQSNVTLSNGGVFSIGGSWKDAAGGKNGELWTAAGGWRNLSGVPVTPTLTADPAGVFRSDNHAWLFAASGGRVLQAGPSRQMNWITTTGNGTITNAGLRADSADAMNGNAVMYDVNKIITMGGSTAYDNVLATRRAYHLDLNGGTVVATRVADMAFQRAFANGVALPDGQVFVVGGQEYPVALTDTRPVLTPELWNPATQQFRQLATMAIPRTYHSVAILLPDARVFVGGGGLCGNCATNHPDGQIFTPPYLLNSDGSARVRPTITSAPATAAPGATISVTTGQAVSQFALVRSSSVTHTVNTDQRRIPLTATSTSGNTAQLTLPADTGVLVPGPYLLFAMNSSGVPSIAVTIRIS